MALNIKQEDLEQMVSTLSDIANNRVQSGIDDFAKMVHENMGNTLMDTLEERCQQMQACYNNKFIPAIQVLLADCAAMEGLQEFVNRAASNLTDTKKVSAEVTAEAISIPEI